MTFNQHDRLEVEIFTWRDVTKEEPLQNYVEHHYSQRVAGDYTLLLGRDHKLLEETLVRARSAGSNVTQVVYNELGHL